MTDTITERPALRKAPTGIAGLDEITHGSCRPAGLRWYAAAQARARPCSASVSSSTAQRCSAEPGVLMSLEENAEELAQDVASLGFDLATWIRTTASRGRLRPHRPQRDGRNRGIRPRGPVCPTGSRRPVSTPEIVPKCPWHTPNEVERQTSCRRDKGVTVDQPPRTTDQRRCWPGSARTRSPARYLPASDRRVWFRKPKGRRFASLRCHFLLGVALALNPARLPPSGVLYCQNHSPKCTFVGRRRGSWPSRR